MANDLIDQLQKNKEMKKLFAKNDDEYDEDEEVDANEESDEQKQRWEKNVRRRVYDALNVLYAAGILQKKGKTVYCDKRSLEYLRQNKADMFRETEMAVFAERKEEI